MTTSFKGTVLIILLFTCLIPKIFAQSGSKMDHTALLIIDVQNDYFPKGKMELVGADAAGAKARQLLEFFRAQGKPVIHIKHIATNEGATFFLPNTTGAEINHYVSPKDGEKVIIKNYPNSFRQTELEAYLKSKGIKKLIITGMMTDVCVDATTRAAFDLGFSNTIISDAIATRNRQLKSKTISAESINKSFLAGLSTLGGLYTEVKTTKQILNN